MDNFHILVVDDLPENLQLLGTNLVKAGYEVCFAEGGEQALEILYSEPIDLVLLDIMMPEMDGFEVCRKIRGNQWLDGVPVIFLTANNETDTVVTAFDVGAVDYVTKPFNGIELLSRVKTQLRLKSYQDRLHASQKELEQQHERLEHKVTERTLDLVRTQDATIHCMASIAEHRDPETGHHILRTQNYVNILATNLRYRDGYTDQIDDEFVTQVTKSAPMHDIGKVGIADIILMKPGPLTSMEFQAIKQHPLIGMKALRAARKTLGDNNFLLMAEQIAWSHHEKWDGSGYPRGLAGADIPLAGRIMAIADVYDALRSVRVYKPAVTHDAACDILLNDQGHHFDPDILAVFGEHQDQFAEISEALMDLQASS